MSNATDATDTLTTDAPTTSSPTDEATSSSTTHTPITDTPTTSSPKVTTASLTVAARLVNAAIEEITPDSTLRCYKSDSSIKQRSWYQFCTHLYDNDLVIEEKFFMFILYQSMRQAKTNGVGAELFSISEYKEIMSVMLTEECNNNLLVPNKFYGCKDNNLIGDESIKQYIYAIQLIHEKQKQSGIINSQWIEIYSSRIRDIRKAVLKRKPRLNYIQAKDKKKHDWDPFGAAMKISQVVLYLWSFLTGMKGTISICNFFRHRFLLLYSCFGILRGQTIISADLSDLIFIDLDHKVIGELTNLQILVLQFCEGM